MGRTTHQRALPATGRAVEPKRRASVHRRKLPSNQTLLRVGELQANDMQVAEDREHASDIAGQPQLKVAHTDDLYEREADAVADHVMRELELQKTSRRHNNQLGTSSERFAVGRRRVFKKNEANSSISKEAKSRPRVHQMPAGCVSGSLIPLELDEKIHWLLKDGEPLPRNARAKFEQHFGTSFSSVRIHHDTVAAGVAAQLGARAWTYKNHIGFGTGQYAPETSEGNRLLGHELTHAVQQGHSSTDKDKAISPTTATSTCKNAVSETPIQRQRLEHTHSVGRVRKRVSITKSHIRLKNRNPYVDIYFDSILIATARLSANDALQVTEKPESTAQGKEGLSVDFPNHLSIQIKHSNDVIIEIKKKAVNSLKAPKPYSSLSISVLSLPFKPGLAPLKKVPFQLSDDPFLIVKQRKPTKKMPGMIEMREAPSRYAAEILQIAGVKKPEAWFKNFVNITFLGRRMNRPIHITLAKHLRSIEQQLTDQFGGENKNPKTAGDYLGMSDEKIKASRPAPTSAVFSMHLFGLAIDIMYKPNPFISSRANAIFRRAGLLIQGKPAQFKRGYSYKQLEELDEIVEEYFSLVDDSDEIRRKLQVATDLPWKGIKVSDALRIIKNDLNTCHRLWRRKKNIIKRGGFMNLNTGLYRALVSEKELSWGGAYGDIMHFDMRKSKVGRKIRRAIRLYKAKKQKEAAEMWKAREGQMETSSTKSND